LDAQDNPPVTLATESVRLPGARHGRDPSRAIKRGPSRVPPEVVAATQRERLFDALAQTVARKGYTAARVSDICDAAGVTRPAFYALFEGKEDAFLATYRYGTDAVLRAMESGYQEAGDWRVGVRTALRILLKVLASVPAFAVMAIVEIDAVGLAGRLERDRVLRCFAPFFADAPRPDLPGPDELADSIVGGIYSTIYRYVAQGRAAELPDLLPLLTYFALAPFVGRAEAKRQLAEDSGEGAGQQQLPKICRRE
jgi:AcrR family transcriptional regulator